jgi:hypothetical protein
MQSLPRKLPLQKVDQYVAKRLKVITPALLNTNMSVNWRVAGGSSKGLTLTVRDMALRSRISKPFGQPKVNDEYSVCLAPSPHQEVIRFYISMQKAVQMQ